MVNERNPATQPALSPPTSTRRRGVPRLLVLVGGVGLVLSISTNAFAASYEHPSITASHATFKVPGGGTATWTLRLWSHGTVMGSDTATSGVLDVAVPATSDCAFQADVKAIALNGISFFFSGSRAIVPGCGVPPPVQTMSGHIYLCSAGSPTTTEVTGGTLAATGPMMVVAQPNPVAPAAVTAGSYTMTAVSPDRFTLVVCGGSATIGSAGQTASESVSVPPGGAGVGLFYVAGPSVAGGGGSTSGGSTIVPAAVAAGSSSNSPATDSLTPAASSHLAFTGMDTAPLLLLGLALTALGTLAILLSRARRLSPPYLARTGTPTTPASRRHAAGAGLRHRLIRVLP